MNIEDKIKDVVSSVLDVSVDELSDSSSKDTIENWDSIRQMDMIVSFEEEFNIELSDNDVLQMLNLGLIKDIIREKVQGLSV